MDFRERMAACICWAEFALAEERSEGPFVYWPLVTNQAARAEYFRLADAALAERDRIVAERRLRRA